MLGRGVATSVPGQASAMPVSLRGHRKRRENGCGARATTVLHMNRRLSAEAVDASFDTRCRAHRHRPRAPMSLRGSNFATGDAARRHAFPYCTRGAVPTTIVDRLELDAAAETRRIAENLQNQIGETLRRGGIVVAMSGGVDSSVCAALAVEAVGPGHVPGLGLRKVRLPARELREIVAATNFKQRVRTMLAYHHADRLNYAVLGTPNS